MSHAGSWRAACSITINILLFHFDLLYEARSVTDPGVGSGALFGGAGTWIIKAMKGEGGGDDSRTECLERATRGVQRT
jgi:hypothetical protein